MTSKNGADLSVESQQQVLWLDIAVNHVLLVAVRQGVGDVANISRGARLAKAFVFRRLQLLVELSS